MSKQPTGKKERRDREKANRGLVDLACAVWLRKRGLIRDATDSRPVWAFAFGSRRRKAAEEETEAEE